MKPPPVINDELNASKQIMDKEWSQLSTCRLIRIAAAGAAGNFLEWFDFSLFGLLANYIADNFFPSKGSDNSIQLLYAFSIYALGYLIRPFGGAIFGYIGDKYGRLFALQLTIVLMSLPTFLTGCLPTYHTIGLTAPILLIILRIIQGLAVGGEGAGCLVYILEICPPSKRSLFGILVQIASGGAVLANIIIAICQSYLTDQQMKSYGWRIPFWCGILLAIFGVRLRFLLPKSLQFEQNKLQGKLVDNPLIETIKKHKCEMFIIILHLIFPNAVYYAEFVWLETYFTNTSLRHNDNTISDIYQYNIYGILTVGAVSIFSGFLGDYIKPYKILLSGGVIHVFSILYLFPKLQYSDSTETFIYIMIFAVTYGLYYGPVSVWAMDMVPESNTRYSSFAIAQNVSVALFSGTMPLLATIIVQNYGIIQFGWLCACYGGLSLGANFVVTVYRFLYKNEKVYTVQNVDSKEHLVS
eukprot:236592_1